MEDAAQATVSTLSVARDGAGQAAVWSPGDASIEVRGTGAVRELLRQRGLLLVHSSDAGELVSIYDVTYLRKPGAKRLSPVRVHDLDAYLASRGLLDSSQGWVHAQLRGDPEVLAVFESEFDGVVRRNEPDLAGVRSPKHSLWLVLPPKVYDRWVSAEIPRLLAEHPPTAIAPARQPRPTRVSRRLRMVSMSG